MSQRTTADAEFGRKFTFGRKLVAFSQFVLRYEGQQLVGLDGFGLLFGFGHFGQVRFDELVFGRGNVSLYYADNCLDSSING